MEMLRELNGLSIAVRILLSIAIGGVLGIERGRRNRPAGFRTYMLVCLGAAMVMMTNQYAFQHFGVSDPVRMGAQVVSGIGFLGAGTIILTGKNQIKGITTAAGLWAAACCGLAVGIGFYEGAIAGGATILVVLAIMQKLDSTLRAHTKTLEIYLEMEPGTRFSSVIDYTREHDIEVFDVQIQKNKALNDGYTSVILTAKSPRRMAHSSLINTLSEAPGIHYIEELQ